MIEVINLNREQQSQGGEEQKEVQHDKGNKTLLCRNESYKRASSNLDAITKGAEAFLG